MTDLHSVVWNGQQFVSYAAAPPAAPAIFKHGKTHAQLVEHYTNYYNLWNAQCEKARLVVAADPNNNEAVQQEKWAKFYSTNSAALAHYHLSISQGGAEPYQRPQSPPHPPQIRQGDSAAPTTRVTNSGNSRNKRRRVARRLRAAQRRDEAREAREAAEREERDRVQLEAQQRERERIYARIGAEHEARAAEREERERRDWLEREAREAEHAERERVQRETAEREERERIRREAERVEREEREATAAAQLAATRISSLEAALEKRVIEEAKDIKETEEKLRERKRSLRETVQSMSTESQSRIALDNTINDSDQNTCVICQDNDSIMAVIPCGHLCLCNGCSDVCMGGQNGQRNCPICRGNMQSVLRIYSGN